MKRFCLTPVVLGVALVLATPFEALAQPVVRAAGFTSTQAQKIVGASSNNVLKALQNNDTKTLAKYVHPVYGVRFSPYAHVDKQSDLVFKRGTVANLSRSKRLYHWGVRDGSGTNINLAWNGFRVQHLVPRDFSKAQVSYNEFRSRGNTLNNLNSAYPQAIFVEYYLPGTPKYGGMDWRGLWLAWRPVGKQWHLVGIAGDQWTT